MGLLSFCWDGSARRRRKAGGGRGSSRPGGRDRLSAKTTLIIYLFICFASRGVAEGLGALATFQLPLPVTGPVLKPVGEDDRELSRLRPPLSFWAREPESAGVPGGQRGQRSCRSQAGCQPLPLGPGRGGG